MVVLIFVSASIRIAKEFPRGVVFRLSRLIGFDGCSHFLRLPALDRVSTWTFGVITIEVPARSNDL